MGIRQKGMFREFDEIEELKRLRSQIMESLTVTYSKSGKRLIYRFMNAVDKYLEKAEKAEA